MTALPLRWLVVGCVLCACCPTQTRRHPQPHAVVAASNAAPNRDGGASAVQPLVPAADATSDAGALACAESTVFVPSGEYRFSVNYLQRFAERYYVTAPVVVEIRRFCLMRMEASAAEYASCVEAGVCRRPTEGGQLCNSARRRPDHPANCMTRRDAEQFCGWRGGRLPTIPEWEYAARYGEAPDGSIDRSRLVGGNFCGCDREQNECANTDSQSDPYCGTAPVSFGPRNLLGLVSMWGNVAEWTGGISQSPSLPEDVRASEHGSLRNRGFVAGCSFRCNVSQLSSQSVGPPLFDDVVGDDVGVRCAFDPR